MVSPLLMVPSVVDGAEVGDGTVSHVVDPAVPAQLVDGAAGVVGDGAVVGDDTVVVDDAVSC